MKTTKQWNPTKRVQKQIDKWVEVHRQGRHFRFRFPEKFGERTWRWWVEKRRIEAERDDQEKLLSQQSQELLTFIRKKIGRSRNIFLSDIHDALDPTQGYEVTNTAIDNLELSGWLRRCSQGLILMNW